ncbi:MAG: hypothetical protein ACR2QT_06215 [Woeseiaceae bacterium]
MMSKNWSKTEEVIRVLLISDSHDMVARLTQQLEFREVSTKIKVMRPGRKAINCARGKSRFGRDPVDLVVIDFSNPDHRSQSFISKLAFGENRIETPIVLLTSDYSEELLDRGAIDCDSSIMFSPTSLTSFLGKMHELSREKFLRTVTIVSGIGPILVRLPGYFSRTLDETPTCQVA